MASLLLFIFVTNFMQNIYNYVPPTDRVSGMYGVASVLYLKSVLHVMLLCM